ncbi:MAG TPA: ATP-binding protein, partial [Kiloniellales bacterium]|nr:ATP-binding protein [Kiloniellales bacterium]
SPGLDVSAGPRPRSTVLALLLLALPAVLTLLGLAGLGYLDWGAAGAGTVIAASLTALVLHRHIGQVTDLRRAIEALRTDLEAELPAAAQPRAAFLCPGLEESLAESVRARNRQRARLKELVAGHEAILESLPDPLILLGRERRITRVNPAAREVLGEAPEGRDLAAVLRHPALLEAVDRVLAGTERQVVEFDLPGRIKRDFGARIARLSAPAQDGSIAVLSLQDLTAMKRVEQLRADFVANASHELRTPLSSLVGFIETLEGPAREDAEARTHFLAVMREQAGRMSRLVEDLLSLSRIELAEHSSPGQAVAPTSILESLADTLGPQARDRDMEIAIEAEPVPPVLGEPDELAQVFQNLIDNAIKYGRPGTPIAVEITAVGPGSAGARRLGRPGVRIAVRDRGEGIAREHIPRLTERFYRVDTARSRRLGGTGLGLAIVKHIVNRHRGVLEIESEPGEGSCFTVYLPAAETAAGEAPKSAAG